MNEITDQYMNTHNTYWGVTKSISPWEVLCTLLCMILQFSYLLLIYSAEVIFCFVSVFRKFIVNSLHLFCFPTQLWKTNNNNNLCV